jgi:hypothetical protein
MLAVKTYELKARTLSVGESNQKTLADMIDYCTDLICLEYQLSE